jgi:hypothetical protein
MSEQQKKYGKLTASELRALLTFLPMMEQEISDLNQMVVDKSDEIFTKNTPKFYWCNYYEKPFQVHFSEIANAYGIQDEVSDISGSDRPSLAMQKFFDAMSTSDSEDEKLPPMEKQSVISFVLALNSSMIFSLRSLMVYGLYLNDLIAIARDGEVPRQDEALLKAIRVDKTVIGCPTAIARLSRAVMQSDQKFMNDLRKAMFGEFDYNKNKNYQKIRYVLQLLSEKNALDLTDPELKELFVKHLNLYSDSQSTAEKNLGEFTRNFKKQKSTI